MWPFQSSDKSEISTSGISFEKVNLAQKADLSLLFGYMSPFPQILHSSANLKCEAVYTDFLAIKHITLTWHRVLSRAHSGDGMLSAAAFCLTLYAACRF